MFIVFMVNVSISFFDQVFDCLYPHSSYRIVQRCLSVLVYVVWVSLHLLNKCSYYMEVAFSRGVENWCLSIAINVVGFTAFLIKVF
jgi:hypothetical protein